MDSASMPSAATTASKPHEPKQLNVGTHVFHRAHGVAEVAGIEDRTVGKERQRFYVLELVAGGRVLLPMDNLNLSRLRTLVTTAHARRLMKLVATEPEIDDTPWKERSALYTEVLKDGAADGFAQVLRQLLFRSKTNKLSMTERRLLDTARTYFVSEVSIVLRRPPEQIDGRLPTDGKRSNE